MGLYWHKGACVSSLDMELPSVPLCTWLMPRIYVQVQSYATLRAQRTSAELQRLLPEELYRHLEGVMLEVKNKKQTLYPGRPAF